MRRNLWARIGYPLLAPVLFGVMLAGAEGAQEPVSSPPGGTSPAPQTVKPRAVPTPAHVREVQRALLNAGYDPGPIDGIFGPRTKSALRKYIAVPPPQAPAAADQVILRFAADERREGP